MEYKTAEQMEQEFDEFIKGTGPIYKFNDDLSIEKFSVHEILGKCKLVLADELEQLRRTATELRRNSGVAFGKCLEFPHSDYKTLEEANDEATKLSTGLFGLIIKITNLKESIEGLNRVSWDDFVEAVDEFQQHIDRTAQYSKKQVGNDSRVYQRIDSELRAFAWDVKEFKELVLHIGERIKTQEGE